MPDPTSVAYDVVAASYADRFLDELDGKPRDRAVLDRFAAGIDGPVVDVGCGPGQIGAYVRGRRRPVFGADLTPAMARLATDRLDGAAVADVRALPFADGSLAGVLAFYSLIHLPIADRPAAFTELARVLRPGGHLLVATQEGEGELTGTELVGHAVSLRYAFYVVDDLVALAEGAGLETLTAERFEPYDDERFPRLFLHARRLAAPDT